MWSGKCPSQSRAMRLLLCNSEWRETSRWVYKWSSAWNYLGNFIHFFLCLILCVTVNRTRLCSVSLCGGRLAASCTLSRWAARPPATHPSPRRRWTSSSRPRHRTTSLSPCRSEIRINRSVLDPDPHLVGSPTTCFSSNELGKKLHSTAYCNFTEVNIASRFLYRKDRNLKKKR